MKNRVFVFFVMLFLLSCKEEKVEFVQSRAIPALILIKNPPKSDSLLKTQIIDFLMKNSLKSDFMLKLKPEKGIQFLQIHLRHKIFY